MLVRPCILVVDPPVEGGISSRKLVLESANFNVIASYSCDEALATLERFPRVHAVVVNAIMHETKCTSLLRTIRRVYPEPVLLIVGKLENGDSSDADYFVDSYSPRVLLETLRQVFPPPMLADSDRGQRQERSISQSFVAG